MTDHLIGFYRDLLNGNATGSADLLAAQNLLHLLMETTATPIFVKDEASRFLACNQAFADYAGLTSAEIVGRFDADMPWAAIGDAHYVDWDRYVIRTGEPRWNIEEPLLLADGSERWLNTNKVPFRHLDGAIIGVIGSIRDVTDQRAAEDALQQMLMSLDQQVSDQTGELLEANRVLRGEISERRRLEGEERQQRKHLEVLRDIASATSTSLDIETVLDRVVVGIRELVFVDLIAILLLDDDSFELGRLDVGPDYTVSSDSPGPDFSWLSELLEPGVSNGSTVTAVPERGFGPARSALASVMVVGGQPVGCVIIECTTDTPLEAKTAQLLSSIAAQAAATISTIRLSHEAVGMAALEERERLARELHDTVIQTLWSISLLSETAKAAVDHSDPLFTTIDRIHRTTTQSQSALRSLVLGMQPDDETTLPLSQRLRQAVSAFSADTKTNVVTRIDDIDLDPVTSTVFHRIAQEALNNTMRHAQADTVTVNLTPDPEPTLTISDNGRGFDPDRRADGHLGLGIMRERASTIGASLEIRSAPGQGTDIVVSGLPADHDVASTTTRLTAPVPTVIPAIDEPNPNRPIVSLVSWIAASVLVLLMLIGLVIAERHATSVRDQAAEQRDRALVLADRTALARAQTDELTALLAFAAGALPESSRVEAATRNEQIVEQTRERLEARASSSGLAADEAQRLIGMIDEISEDWNVDRRKANDLHQMTMYLRFDGRTQEDDPPSQVDALARLLELDDAATLTVQEAMILELLDAPLNPTLPTDVQQFVTTTSAAIALDPGYLGPDEAEPLDGGVIDPTSAQVHFESDVAAMNRLLSRTPIWEIDQWVRNGSTTSVPTPLAGVVPPTQEAIDQVRAIADERAAAFATSADSRAQHFEDRQAWLRLAAFVCAVASVAAAARALAIGSGWIRRVHRSTRVDPLTGIGNRKLLETMTSDLIERPDLRYHAVVMIDMDRFKLVNDTYGHAFGDRLLQLLAAGLRDFSHYGLASESTAVRLGGDEFLLSLHSSHPIEHAALCDALEQLRNVHVSHDTGELVPLAFSYGVASAKGAVSLAQLMNSADLLAYQQKDQRRAAAQARQSTPLTPSNEKPDRTPSS